MSESPVCQCCLEEIAAGCGVKYILKGPAQPFKDSVYCSDCMKMIHEKRWGLMKKDLLGVECLGVFRRIVKRGLPMCLLEYDVAPTGEEQYQEVDSLIYEVPLTFVPAHLQCDLTAGQRDELVADLRALAQDMSSVTDHAVREIATKYWPEND